jgi:hypothetical protein
MADKTTPYGRPFFGSKVDKEKRMLTVKAESG